MKKLYLFFLFIAFKGMSQGVELPSMTLPSPQAFEITKFGNTPVDESSGRVSPSIPICTYTAGALQIPISLSYSGNGVKVEQRPTWTGINWLLNAGGVITRVVKDLPDEALGARVFYSATELDALIDPTAGGIPYSIKNPIAHLPYLADSEVDDFSFSFPGYSGSFILKKNTAGVWEGKLLKYENELKIEILGNFAPGIDYIFKITTPDGTKYYFGGKEEESGLYAVEESQFINRSSGPFPQYGERSKTAFYLTKIENYLGDVIHLDYYTKDSHEVFASSDSSIEEFLKGYDHDFSQGPCELLPTSNHNFNAKFIRNIIYNAKFLKRISSPMTSRDVVFNSVEVDHEITQPATLDLKFRVLSDIDFGLGRANFEYLPTLSSMLSSTTSHREKFFLEKVTLKNADSTQKSEEYTLEYDEALAVPENSFSNAQDYLGYYNKKINTTLLPRNSMGYTQYYLDEIETAGIAHLEYGNFSTFNSTLGDRSSDFTYATKGILTKIKYPTGGSTAFEYEPVEPKYKSTNNGTHLFIYNKGGITNPPRNNPEDDTVDIESVGFNQLQIVGEPIVEVPQIYGSQTVEFTINISLSDRATFGVKDFVYIDQKTSNGTLITRQRAALPPMDYSQNPLTQFTRHVSFYLVHNEHYIFEMGLGSNPGDGPYDGPDVPFEITATMQFVSEMAPDGGNGIRIKRVKDYENDTAQPTNIRRFYYKTLKDVINQKEDNKVMLFRPLFHSFRTDISACPNPINPFNPPHNHNLYIQLHTNSFTLNFPSSDVLAAYPAVTISLGGDNFEQGAIEKYFLIQPSPYQISYPVTTAVISVSQFIYSFNVFNDAFRTNQSTFNGTLLEENIWQKKDSELQKIKKQKTFYGFHVSQIAYNINGQEIYPTTTGVADPIPDNVFLGLYSTNSHKINSTVTTTTEFIGGIPISKYTTPPPVDINQHGHWQNGDHDGDGIINNLDDQFITPTEFASMTDEEIEDPYYQLVTNKRIINTQEVVYNQLAGLPSSSKITNSTGETIETKSFYPITHDINAVSSSSSSSTPPLTPWEVNKLNTLNQEFRIGEPFQVESWNNSNKLSAQRTEYTGFDQQGISSVHKYKIKTSKGIADLEDRIIYKRYDTKGNPVELSLVDGTKVVYIWSPKRKPIYKIVNSSYNEVITAMGTFTPIEDDGTTPLPPILANPFITALPNAQVTIYNYDTFTQLIKSVVNPNGDVSYYNYDTFLRLENIKDREGKILQEFKNNYRPN